MSFLEKSIQNGTLPIIIFGTLFYFFILTVIFIIPVNFLLCWGWEKFKNRRISARALVMLNIFFVGAYAFFIWYSLYEPNPLRKYGFEYQNEGNTGGATYSPDRSVDMWIQTPSGKIEGPYYNAPDLSLHFKDVDHDGIYEIIVSSDSDPHERKAIVKLIIKNGKAVGFRVLDDDLPHYP